jgi:hypothetical protein
VHGLKKRHYFYVARLLNVAYRCETLLFNAFYYEPVEGRREDDKYSRSPSSRHV